jgi:hypothetical protein
MEERTIEEIYRLKLDLQKKAGVIELSGIYRPIEEAMDIYLKETPDLPSVVLAHNATLIMRAMGINPIPEVLVQKYPGEVTSEALLECYNSDWYFLYKGDEKTMLSDFCKDGLFYCPNAIIAKHNNNPEEGKAKIDNYLKMLEQYDL